MDPDDLNYYLQTFAICGIVILLPLFIIVLFMEAPLK